MITANSPSVPPIGPIHDGKTIVIAIAAAKAMTVTALRYRSTIAEGIVPNRTSAVNATVRAR